MNIRKPAIWIAVIVLVCGGAIAFGQSTTAQAKTPTTRPESRRPRSGGSDDTRIRIPQPTEMSRAYDLLNSYSLFARGRLQSSDSGGSSGGGFNSQAPENVLVLTGVTITDHNTVAFIEDTSQGTVKQVKVGDSIAQGKISDITLEELDYKASDGHVVHVGVGQNLRGESAFGLIYGTGIGTSPAESDQNVDAGTAAIMAKLRAKRLQEMGVAPAAPATQPAQ
jgi:hypothetical protein